MRPRIGSDRPAAAPILFLIIDSVQKGCVLRPYRLLVLCLFLGAVDRDLIAQWTTGGPAGVAIQSLAVDSATPGRAYAGAGQGGGVYVTTDAGEHWAGPNLGPFATPAIASGFGSQAFAGTADRFVFRSVDGGVSWQGVLDPDSTSSSVQLLVSPCDPSVVYLSFAPKVFSTPALPGQLWRSVDSGRTWANVSPSIYSVHVAIDGRDGCRLYAAASLGGMFQSTDLGQTWSAIPNGLNTFQHVAVDPGTARRLYAIILDASGSPRLAKSVDGGQTFSQVLFLNFPATGIAIDPLDSRSVFVGTNGGGVYRSTDGGLTWAQANGGLGSLSVTSVAIDAVRRVLHAGTGSGVFELALPPLDKLSLLASHPFDVQVAAVDQRTGRTASGQPMPQNDRWGTFSLPGLTGDAGNPEVFIKILDGTPVNGKYWIFYGGLTDVEYTITVTERATGTVRTYTKPAGSSAGGFDTSAFP